jgi:hypothetical protein
MNPVTVKTLRMPARMTVGEAAEDRTHIERRKGNRPHGGAAPLDH